MYSRGGPSFLARQLQRAFAGSQGFSRTSIFIGVAFLVWAFYIVQQYIEDQDFEHSHNFCDKDQPAYTVYENYVPEEFLPILQREVREFIRERQDDKKWFSPEGFGNHLAFAFKFNDEGLEALRKRTDIDFLHPLLSMMRNPRANSFTLRILAGLPSNGSEEVAKLHADIGLYSDPEKRAAGDMREWHVVPYTTSVLYLTVPPDMRGGTLELRNEKPGAYPKKWRVEPTENTLVVFRGDVAHVVHGYSTQTDMWRISIVFQQFTLPPRLYKFAEYMEDC